MTEYKIVEETDNLIVVEPSVELIFPPGYDELMTKIELCGKTAYKAEGNIREGSAEAFVRKIIELGHESVLEHASITVKVVCDRGVSHEIVRHRIASYTQESTRYCNYATDKFKNKLWVVKPVFLRMGSANYLCWRNSMDAISVVYRDMIKENWKPEEARSVLPNSLKTELCMTMNIREWRHFFRLRTAANAHPQIREIAGMILEKFKSAYPALFSG